jgi:hypothetical protein
VRYEYALAGDGTPLPQVVPGAEQHAALDALVATLDVDVLGVPARLVPLLSVGANQGDDRQTDIEIMDTAGPGVFDSLEATETGAAVTLEALFAPQRLNRLEVQSRADAAVPSAMAVIDAALDKAFAMTGRDAASAAVQRRIATTTAFAAVRLQRDKALSPTLSLALADRLSRLATKLQASTGTDEAAAWARGLGALLGDREALDAALAAGLYLPSIPPGMPI